MRALLAVAVCVLAVSVMACGGGRVTTKPDELPVAKEKAQPKQDAPASKLPQTLEQLHQGRNAEQWGRELLDSDERTSNTAAFALQAIGDEALRFVYPGFTSKHPHVRSRAVFVALNLESAAKYPDVFLPPLKKLLTDEDAEVRGYTALTIARVPFPDGLDAIREARGKEMNPDVKRQMDEAIKLLTKK